MLDRVKNDDVPIVLEKHLTPDPSYADTHRALVEQCKAMDRTAQFELYRLYSKAMYNVCLRMMGNTLDAEDMLQNAFVDIFSKLHTFKYQSSIGAWIKRIVINNCINQLKRRRLQLVDLDSQPIGEFEEEAFQGYISESDEYTVDAIKAAMQQLPDGYRVVFSLYLLEGYDHKEIANILDISESTSKSQYSRARRKLRELLTDSPLFFR